MSNFNQVTLMGRLTREIELKYTGGGLAFANVSLAVSERRKKGEEWIEEVSYIDCTLFGRKSEVASEYLTKGSAVLFSGRLRQERWQDKEGQNRSKVVVVVDNMVLLPNRESGGVRQESTKSTAKAPAESQRAFEDEEIPF